MIIGSISVKYSFRILVTSSADIFSLILVNPLISENKTVTIARFPPSLRSSMLFTTFFIMSWDKYFPIACLIFSLFLFSVINLNEYPKTKVIISALIGITGFVIIPQSARIITAIKYTKFRPIIDSKPLNTLVFKIIPKTKIERIKNENKSSAKTSKPSFCKKSPNNKLS